MGYQVTVAMPVYNIGSDIERALYSALGQTFESIEFLIIDDKGTDNSMEIVRRIIADNPRGKDVRIIDHGVNRGTGATKNSAIKEAQGKYLYFMDSDDVIVPDCIDLLYREITRNPVDFVAASFRKVSADGKDELSVTQLPNITCREPYALAKYRKGKESSFYIMTWNKLFDIAFLRDNRIYCIPHHLNEDVWFSFQLYFRTSSFTFLSRVTYDWYVRANSTTHTVINNGLKVEKINSYLEALEYKKEVVRTDNMAAHCPYIIDDIVEFCLRLSEGILRSNLSSSQKREYILKVIDIQEIADRHPDRAANRFAFALFKNRCKSFLFGYLYAVRYGRGVLHALSHPMSIIRKILN